MVQVFDTITPEPLHESDMVPHAPSWFHLGWCSSAPHIYMFEKSALDLPSQLIMVDTERQCILSYEVSRYQSWYLICEVSPGLGQVLVLDDSARHIAMLRLPSLDHILSITPPACFPGEFWTNGPLVAASRLLKPSWAEWCPRGTAFAVAWSSDNQLLHVLGIYCAADGSQIGLVDVLVYMSRMPGHSFSQTKTYPEAGLYWSPTGAHILMNTYASSAPTYLIIDVNGTCHGLPCCRSCFTSSKLSFSNCGCYIAVRERFVKGMTHQEAVMQTGTSDYIRDLDQQRTVYQWTSSLDLQFVEVVWGPMPGICFVPDQDIFVFLTQQRPDLSSRPQSSQALRGIRACWWSIPGQ